MSNFILCEDERGRLSYLAHPDDKYAMNWVEGATAWGTIKTPQWPAVYRGWGEPKKPYRLDVEISRTELENGRLRERYVFYNHSDFEIFTLKNEIGIYTCFNDSYESAEICKTRRCTAHVWCGGDVCYVMAVRMGGEPPHLGLTLTNGSITGYSVERDVSKGSNDRGDIILHPAPMRLMPGESAAVEWELFWFDDEKHFREILNEYPRFIDISAPRYVLFEGERARLTSTGIPSLVDEPAQRLGERRYEFYKNGARTFAETITLPKPSELCRARCQFIARKQQCDAEKIRLYGDYLIYDNEENRRYYSHSYDHDAARERVGMGALVARYLRANPDAELAASLDKYLDYVLRELFDEETGTVYNDYARGADWHRIYNYPWMATLFTQAALLKNDARYLLRAAKAIKKFYASGGKRLYAICLDVPFTADCLERAGMSAEADELKNLFLAHANEIYAFATDYPPHEVNYEQSIVQPAAEIMMQAYECFGDEKFLASAKTHIKLLELFNAHQPSFHQNEVALRHWDGYWFGKERLLGDNYPHYWSALTGQSFARYSVLTGDNEYKSRAENALRGPLSLFRPDGSASCAMIFPETVNGRKARLYDPWANDQDWAMYIYLKWHDGLETR